MTIEQLTKANSAAPDAALRAFATAPRDRDVMTARFSIRSGDEQTAPDVACRVGGMRRIAAARLRYCGLHALTDDVMLIVSELVTNAVLHSGGTQIVFEMALRDGALQIAVGSDKPGRPQVQVPHHGAETGRGLLIVAALANEHRGGWGTSADGTTTWCRLSTREAQR